MKKSFAKLYFTDINKPLDIKMGFKWGTPTVGIEPNNWSTGILFLDKLQSDNSAEAIIFFLVEEANYLHKEGIKFELFGANQFKCTCEVIKVL